MGIIDFSFELLYQKTRQNRLGLYRARFSDDTKFILYYLNDDANVTFNESGMMLNAELRFLKIDTNNGTMYINDVHRLIADADYVKNNTIMITRNFMPEHFENI